MPFSRAHLVQIYLSDAQTACRGHISFRHMSHCAIGEEGRAARPRFGPPHRRHNPAALLKLDLARKFNVRRNRQTLNQLSLRTLIRETLVAALLTESCD